mgnify:CR=1 FL=1
MCNIGKLDRIARAFVGVILVVVAFATPYWWLGIVGGVFLTTAAIRFCPVYPILKLNTGCEAKTK